MEPDREEPDAEADAGAEPEQPHDPVVEPVPAAEDELWRPFRKVRRFRRSDDPPAVERSPDV